MRRVLTVVFLACLATAWGCDASGPESGEHARSLAESETVTVGGVDVTFSGAIETPEGVYFTYVVPPHAGLDALFIESTCDGEPVAISPENGELATNTDTGVAREGILWTDPVGPLVVVIPGATVGVVYAVATVDGVASWTTLPGPCGAGELTTISGSVFVNDGDDATPEESRRREPRELGVERVRVDVFAPGAALPLASAITDAQGRYTFAVPAGDWVVRVTPEGGGGVFNPNLFAVYDPAAGPAERTVTVDASVADVDFGFDPDLEAILAQLTSGRIETEARTLFQWRQWVRDAVWYRRCPARDDWVCKEDIEIFLDAIFASPGDEEGFFGNPVPFLLPPAVDPLVEAYRILNEAPNAEEGQLVQELFVMQLNYQAGFGSPDRIWDQTLLYYLEEYVVTIGAVEDGVEARKVAGDIQLQIARAYNRGGGGGGDVGN